MHLSPPPPQVASCVGSFLKKFGDDVLPLVETLLMSKYGAMLTVRKSVHAAPQLVTLLLRPAAFPTACHGHMVLRAVADGLNLQWLLP